MNESIISVRYTKAIFALAKEKNLLEEVKSDVETIFSLMNESSELLVVFKSPVLKPSKKKELVKLVFGSFNKITISFINLLIDNRREEHLHDISRNFIDKYRKYKRIESAQFTTSVHIDSTVLTKVKQLIENVLKTEVEFTGKIDDRIIGGFILRVGDKQFDASVQTSLNKVKRKLLNTTIG
jgi:F-type H+-transporting ATPase subunit delta